MTYSGNILADMMDEERERNDKEYPKCPNCGSEDGLHYCPCNRQISESNCHQGFGCPDCR